MLPQIGPFVLRCPQSRLLHYLRPSFLSVCDFDYFCSLSNLGIQK